MKNKSGMLTILITLFALLFFAISPMVHDALNAKNRYDDVIEDLRDLIEDEMDDQEITGLSIALIDDQKIVWAEGFGYADERAGVKTAPDTIYQAGTMSEIFTSKSVYRLHMENKIDIDKDIRKYLPEFDIKSPGKEKSEIKIRSLMTHHGGLPTDHAKGQYNLKSNFRDLVNAMKDTYMAFKPDFVFSFSNVGLSLLGYMVEKVSGDKFEDYTKTTFFNKMDMKKTGYKITPQMRKKIAKSYHEEEERPRLSFRDVPAIGLHTNVLDMSKFVMTLFNNGKYKGKEVFTQKEMNAYFKPLSDNIYFDYDLKMGVGWVLTNVGDNLKYAGPIAWHDFSFNGHSGRIVILRKHKLGIIVMTNSPGGVRSAAAITSQGIKDALKAKTGLEQPEWQEPELKEVYTQAELAKFAGEYATSIGTVVIEQNDEELKAEAMGYNFALKQNEKGNFSGRVVLLGFIKIKAGPLSTLEFAFERHDGHDVIILYRFGEGFLIGEKLSKTKITREWLSRMGTYTVTNRGGDLRYYKEIKIGINAGRMTAEILRDRAEEARARALDIINPSLAAVTGLGRAMGDKIKFFTKNGNEFLKYSGYIFKKK